MCISILSQNLNSVNLRKNYQSNFYILILFLKSLPFCFNP